MQNKSFNTIIEKDGKKYFCYIRKRKNVNEYRFSVKINDINGLIMIAGFCGGTANKSPYQAKYGFTTIENKKQAIKFLTAIL
jgi:hypothetical protein